jgi:NAD(P)-dependent dehydrogenase (short-subunit alcohol dehydrogenase family)
MKDKVLFITGGNDGIGLSTAIMFAERGANIAIFSRRAKKNDIARNSIEELGARCIVIAGDVANESDVANAVRQTLDTFGGLHFAFNNAGITGNLSPLATSLSDEFDRIIGTNLKGVWLAMKHELPAIVASGGGGIVNTGSIASHIGLPLLSIYNASKHGVLGLTKSAALEYARQGVRVNAICPGNTADTGIYRDFANNSPQLVSDLAAHVPMGRLCKPQEIAASVLYLCSDAASYITGQALYVDGGFTVP